MPRTQLGRDLDTLHKFESEILAIWRTARKHGDNHEYILDALNVRVWNTASYKKLPRWAQNRLIGYNRALSDLAIFEFTETRAVIDGEALTVDEWLSRGLTHKEIHEKGAPYVGYWIKANKPF